MENSKIATKKRKSAKQKLLTELANLLLDFDKELQDVRHKKKRQQPKGKKAKPTPPATPIGSRGDQYELLLNMYDCIITSEKYSFEEFRQNRNGYFTVEAQADVVAGLAKTIRQAFAQAYKSDVRAKRQRASVWSGVLSHAWVSGVPTHKLIMKIFRSGGIIAYYKDSKLQN